MAADALSPPDSAAPPGRPAAAAGDPPPPTGDPATPTGGAAPPHPNTAEAPRQKPAPPDAAEQPGDEERAHQQEEVRSTVTEALASFGMRSSSVIIVGDKLTFEGPVTGGDTTLGRGGGTPLLVPVPARTITEIARVHVRPDGFDDLVAALRQENILLLRAPRRWGSTTTAVRLMSTAKAVHELHFGGTLATLPMEELPAGCGFVLERLTALQLAELRARDLPALDERLAKLSGKLVVIVDVDARLADHALNRAARTLHAPPSARELVASHLGELLGSRHTAERFLTDHHLIELLVAVEPASFDAQQLVELARDLAEVANGQGTVEDALARFGDRSRRDVEAWLDSITAFDQRAIVVSLAALNGMSYDAVSRAATLLEQAWRVDDAGEGVRPSRARQPRTSRLFAARARLSTEVRRTRYGLAEIEVVSFVDDAYPARVLHHLWHEHDYDRDVVLAWLKAVAGDVERSVGIRAAMALGYLGQFAFDTIRRDVVVPWAGSGNGEERERAVAALTLPARHPDTAHRVIRLVLEWCEREDQSLRLAAARALGRSVGGVLPGGPDKRLAALAEKADARLAVAIGDSVAELLAEADLERQLQLLRLLDGWSTEGRRGRQRAGIFGFLTVAGNLWSTVRDDDITWPTLLWLASAAGPATEGARAVVEGDRAQLTAVREIVSGLWGRALVAPGADHAVRAVLRRWASAAERSPQLRPPLISLLVEAATTPRQATLLAFHAKDWRERRPLAPDLAERLLDVLHRRGGALW